MMTETYPEYGSHTSNSPSQCSACGPSVHYFVPTGMAGHHSSSGILTAILVSITAIACLMLGTVFGVVIGPILTKPDLRPAAPVPAITQFLSTPAHSVPAVANARPRPIRRRQSQPDIFQLPADPTMAPTTRIDAGSDHKEQVLQVGKQLRRMQMVSPSHAQSPAPSINLPPNATPQDVGEAIVSYYEKKLNTNYPDRAESTGNQLNAAADTPDATTAQVGPQESSVKAKASIRMKVTPGHYDMLPDNFRLEVVER